MPGTSRTLALACSYQGRAASGRPVSARNMPRLHIARGFPASAERCHHHEAPAMSPRDS